MSEPSKKGESEKAATAAQGAMADGTPATSEACAPTPRVIPEDTKGIPAQENCQTCRRTEKNGVPYNEFFTEEERRRLDEIGQNNPDLVALLPPKDGKYYPTAGPEQTERLRDQFHTKRARLKKDKVIGGGEIHHPRAIAAGGCPFHQQLLELPTDPAAYERAKQVDKQIQEIVDGAINRHRAQAKLQE
jgi:hypothetical protein